MPSGLSLLKTMAQPFPIAILIYRVGGTEFCPPLLHLLKRRGKNFALYPPPLLRRAMPFPLPSFSREEERESVLSVSPSSLGVEGSPLLYKLC